MIVAYIHKEKITPFLCKSLSPLLESPFIFGSRAEHFFKKKNSLFSSWSDLDFQNFFKQLQKNSESASVTLNTKGQRCFDWQIPKLDTFCIQTD